LVEKEKEIYVMSHSNSWKLTKPLRKIGSVLRNMKYKA